MSCQVTQMHRAVRTAFCRQVARLSWASGRPLDKCARVCVCAVSAQVSSKAVQELRRKSGAGMMDCKKALAECDMDMEKASDWLRQKVLVFEDGCECDGKMI